jgi:uncharacterized protein (TIGR02301 family)
MMLASAGAYAQDRAPSQRQILIDLAYVLGQSHALRQVCEGAGDQFWRDRMIKLIRTESPESAFDRRLKESFNTGYVAGQAAFPACGPDARREAERTAARGRVLTESLAHAPAEMAGR